MSDFAAWLALGLVLMLWAALLVVWILALRFWRQVGPTVTPMLAMFAPAQPVTVSAGSSTTTTAYQGSLDRIADTVERPAIDRLCTCGRPASEHSPESGGCPGETPNRPPSFKAVRPVRDNPQA